jgi:hypothetical protein
MSVIVLGASFAHAVLVMALWVSIRAAGVDIYRGTAGGRAACYLVPLSMVTARQLAAELGLTPVSRSRPSVRGPILQTRHRAPSGNCTTGS